MINHHRFHQESNQSQDYCNCSYGGEDLTSTGTLTATHDPTRIARYGFDVMSTAGTSQPVPPITTLERYNEIIAAKLVKLSQD